MVTPLLNTKLYIPPARSGLITRPLLDKRIAEGIRRKLTLICAPPGFGKTTIIANWLASIQATGKRVAWLTLDEGDKEFSRFIHYMVESLNGLQEGLTTDTRRLLQVHPTASPDPVMTSLINDLCKLEKDSIFVLDDYHVISTPEIHQSIQYLITNMPEPLHLVIITRSDPPLTLARIRANLQMVELRAEHLRFNLEETTQFLNEKMHLGLTREEIQILHRRTEGWIAGLQLAGLSMQESETPTKILASLGSGHEYIIDYLVEEILDNLPQEQVEFILQISILDRLTGALCNALTGRSDGDVLLNQLEKMNLFIVPLDFQGRWWRFHHLFGEVTQNILRQRHPEKISILHQKASEWYESENLVEDSITHAFAADDFQRAARLIEANALDMIRLSQLKTLMSYLSRLPGPIIQHRPWLCVIFAWGRYHYGPRQETETYCQLADQALIDATGLADPERKRINSFISAVRAFHALQEENIERIHQMAENALELAPDWDFVNRLGYVALGFAYWGRGDAAASQHAFRQSKIIALQLDDPSHAINGAGLEAVQQIKQGKLIEAESTLREALSFAELPDERELPITSYAHIRLGELARERNNLSAARQHLDIAIEMCTGSGSPDFTVDAYQALIRLYLAKGEFPQAQDALVRANKITHRTSIDPFVITWLNDASLRYWLAIEDWGSVKNWVANSGLDASQPFSYFRDLDQINLARVWVAYAYKGVTNEFLGTGLNLLDRLSNAALSKEWHHQAIQILILKALAHQALGDDQAALDAISHALSLAEAGAYVRIFLDEGIGVERLLRAAITHQKSARYCSQLLTVFKDSFGTDHIRGGDLLDPLSDRELDVLKLLAGGYSNQEIGEQLIIAEGTVKRHVYNIFSKLNVRNRAACVTRANELHLLD